MLSDFFKLPKLTPKRVWQLYNLSIATSLATLSYFELADVPKMSMGLYFWEAAFPSAGDLYALAGHSFLCYQAKSAFNDPKSSIATSTLSVAEGLNHGTAAALRTYHLAKTGVGSVKQCIHDYRHPKASYNEHTPPTLS